MSAESRWLTAWFGSWARRVLVTVTRTSVFVLLTTLVGTPLMELLGPSGPVQTFADLYLMMAITLLSMFISLLLTATLWLEGALP